MVCLIPNIIMSNNANNSEASENTNNKFENSVDEIIEDDNDDPLKLKRIAGGSIIEHPPLFSPNGELLFIAYRECIQIYSTKTGQLLRSLEGSKNKIINFEYEINNNKILVGCTELGEIFMWKWESGSIERKMMLKYRKILTFNLLDISSTNSYALIILDEKNSEYPKSWSIIDIKTGKSLECPRFTLSDNKINVATEIRHFHYFAITQDDKMYIVDYKNWRHSRCLSPKNVPFTHVKCHPTEELIATGDSLGRIFLWREFFKKRDKKIALYHWHHTEITSIAFTNTGSGFYSGGLESVLVKWNIHKPDIKNFLPRMTAPISHIVVGNENQKVAIATFDNGIQILDDQGNAECILQNFTYASNDNTGLDKFPVGLKLNPRSNCLVLNGRTGHLQFYSTYTKNLLYNMDIVIQNRLSRETQKILYDIQITKAAFNVDWLATTEIWNDQEHLVETRLKFWEFKKESQSYCLNTNIELPHEEGIKALEFSDSYQSENLLCVSVGNDNIIKVWSLEDSDNIYKKGKVWYCTGKTDFKNMNIESVSFSLDGSLLAAGFGNCLCIYKSDNLKIKAVLTTPNCNDGTVKTAQIKIPSNHVVKDEENKKKFKQVKNKIKSEKSKIDGEYNDKQRKILDLLTNLIENDEQELITQIKKNSEKIKYNEKINLNEFENLKKSNENLENILFKKILSLVELNFFQKLCLMQKLKIFCTVSAEKQNKIINYIALTIMKLRYKEDNFHRQFYKIEKRKKFKAKQRLYKYFNQQIQKSEVEKRINNEIIPLLKLLNINYNENIFKYQTYLKYGMNDNFKKVNRLNGFCDYNQNVRDSSSSSSSVRLPKPTILHSSLNSSVQSVSSIKRVLFGAADFAHLVVVCTEHRILIWNILTLKLQCVLKLSTHEITVDPITSLFAVFTTNNELYVFLPNAPMPFYHRTNLPKIKGACWVPRKYPKSQSINLDWQSTSKLYFLTESQELMHLSPENDMDNLSAPPTQLSNDNHEFNQYTTFGTFAIKQINLNKSKNMSTSGMITSSAIGVAGKHSIKSLINFPTHAMAPANLLCHSITKSLVGIEDDEKSKISSKAEKFGKNYNIENDNDSDDEIFEKYRKAQQPIMDNLKSDILKKQNLKTIQENDLKKMFDEVIDIFF